MRISDWSSDVCSSDLDSNAEVATPVLADPASLTEENIFDFSSGYIQRALHIMPKNADRMPWRLSQNYVQDRIDMRTGAIDDGILAFGHAHPAEVSTAALVAAEYSVDMLGLALARALG